MKEGACKVISVITTILFILASLMLLVGVIPWFVDSKKLQTPAFFMGVLLVIIIAFLLQAKFFINKKHIKLKIITINLLSIILFIFTFSLLIPDSALPKHFGHNINVYSYQNSIGGKAYKDLNDAASNIKTEKGMIELYRFDAEKYAVVFYKNDEQIISYEFFKQDGRYYTYGSRKIIYDNADWNSALADTEYTEEETMLADIENSIISSHNEWLNKSGQYPAFGVLDTSRVQNVDISGQPVDTVIEIKNEQGKVWFFWFIENLDAQEMDEVVINGL